MEFLSEAAVYASGAVLLVQQILKLKVVPLSFANRWPVLTNIALSVVATIFIVKPNWDWSNLPELAAQIGTVSVVAAIAYNMTIRNEPAIKKLEG